MGFLVKPMYTQRDILTQLPIELPRLIPQLRFKNFTAGEGKANLDYDFSVNVDTETGLERILVGAIKSSAQPRFIREAIIKLKESLVTGKFKNAYPIICSTFLSERVRKICKDYQAGYFDLAGNCYLKFDGFHLEKVVEKNPFKEDRKLRNIFQPVSSRILRVLLEKPKTIWKISDLAREAETSVGLCYKVTQRLQDQEFIKRDQNKKIILTNPTELLNNWRENYSFEQNKVLSFFSLEKNISKLLSQINALAKKNKSKYALTLLPGANLVAPFVRSTDVYFYISKGGSVGQEDPEMWKKGLDLKEVEFGGNVHLAIPYDQGVFYGFQEIDKLRIVGNIQLYLDLYKYPARGKEQAEFLREQKIKF